MFDGFDGKWECYKCIVAIKPGRQGNVISLDTSSNMDADITAFLMSLIWDRMWQVSAFNLPQL